MLLHKEAHLGEVSVSVWPQVLKDLGTKRNIQVLEFTLEPRPCHRLVVRTHFDIMTEEARQWPLRSKKLNLRRRSSKP
jgi:hypothetical protein